MHYKFLSGYFFVFCLFLISFKPLKASSEVIFPEIILSGITSDIEIKLDHSSITEIDGIINDQPFHIVLEDGKGKIPYAFKDKETIVIKSLYFSAEQEVNPIPLWLSILPPFIAIFMALFFKEVITSLFLGILFGAVTIHIYSDGLVGLLTGFTSVIDTYIITALHDEGHLSVITFSMLIGAMVAVISKNGGMQGVVNKLSKYASNSRSGQLITWFLGILIFFDDYANTLIVGNTMRPLTDRLKISREKLSYIVDSTAAPIAAIAFVTTWIGAELGYIDNGIKGLAGISEGVYTIFLNSLKYSFYPIFTLAFILFLVWKQKDYGPMLKAERKARKYGIQTTNDDANNNMEEFEAISGKSHRWYNAAIPVGVVILVTIVGLYYTGKDAVSWEDSHLSFFQKLSKIIGASDSYLALLWSSLSGLLAALLLTLTQKILDLNNSVKSIMAGFKTMLTAIIILVLAWSLALITEHLHTADFITSLLSDSISPNWFPPITFLLGALVAFSTGSSWGTMAILYPLMLPATWKISQEAGIDPELAMSLFYNVVSSILAGSVLGDHCSPISDTTILSSLASSCNHIDHVKTQLPYALSVGLVALVIGTIPTSFGVHPIISIIAGLGVLYAIVHFFGKNSNEIV